MYSMLIIEIMYYILLVYMNNFTIVTICHYNKLSYKLAKYNKFLFASFS